ncbi:MAG: hypothetical protein QXG86_01995 [Candidatus Woesearchaeota archaeon]
MEKKIYLVAILCIAAIMIIGCSKQKIIVTEKNSEEPIVTKNQNEVSKEAKSSETKSPQQSNMPDISQLEKEGLECLKPGVRVCRPVNLREGKVGDVVGFAFGITNLENLPKKFVIKPQFVRTQLSVGQAPIEADKDYMNRWLSLNDLEAYYELKPGEKISKPILIKIGEMVSADKETPAGTYVFEIQAQIYEDGFYENYEPAQQISVRVK